MQKNCVTSDLELATIVHALKMWKHYLLGRIFELITYHMRLKYLFEHLILNDKKARWLELLCEFYFEINHVKGKENKVFDALSKKFHVTVINVSKSNLRTRALGALANDEHYIQVKEGLQKEKLEKRYGGYQLEGYNLLYLIGKLYIPNCVDLWKMVLDEIHLMPYPRHKRSSKNNISRKKEATLVEHQKGHCITYF